MTISTVNFYIEIHVHDTRQPGRYLLFGTHSAHHDDCTILVVDEFSSMGVALNFGKSS